jgi:hypothetical protein
MPNALDIKDWQAVPARVAALLPAAVKLRAAHEKAALAAGILPISVATWNPELNALTLYSPTGCTKRAYETYENLIHDDALGFAAVAGGEPNWDEEILIKRGSAIPGVKHIFDGGNALLGGPTPLSNGIVSGLLLGGLGYGGGTLAENLFPERYLERGKLRRTLGLLGAGTGLGLGAMNAYANARALKIPFLQGLITNNKTPVDYLDEKRAFMTEALYGHNPVGALQQPMIPVPQFNNATWRDVQKGMRNPYGTHTPPDVAAATTGLMTGISTSVGSPIIRPLDVVRGIASAGVGLATANLAGKTLSALAGLTPEAQNKLQDMGLWAGMLTSVVPPLFGRR